jgi:hypothetical protein
MVVVVGILDVAPTLGNDFGWAGFVAGTLTDTGLPEGTFARLASDTTPASRFLFVGACPLAAELGSERGSYGMPAYSNTLLTLPRFGSVSMQAWCSPRVYRPITSTAATSTPTETGQQFLPAT